MKINLTFSLFFIYFHLSSLFLSIIPIKILDKFFETVNISDSHYSNQLFFPLPKRHVTQMIFFMQSVKSISSIFP